ncbi:MAG: transglycosylase SLT domain-containing protein [Acidimicrobiia bacterium]
MLNPSRLRLFVVGLIAVAVMAGCTNEEMIRVAFANRGANETQQDQAIRVAQCESNLQPGAVSPGGGNWGLFQINKVHTGRVAAHGFAWSEMLYPWQNAVVAADLWAEAGWQPWSCARRLGIR